LQDDDALLVPPEFYGRARVVTSRTSWLLQTMRRAGELVIVFWFRFDIRRHGKQGVQGGNSVACSSMRHAGEDPSSAVARVFVSTTCDEYKKLFTTVHDWVVEEIDEMRQLHGLEQDSRMDLPVSPYQCLLHTKVSLLALYVFSKVCLTHMDVANMPVAAFATAVSMSLARHGAVVQPQV